MRSQFRYKLMFMTDKIVFFFLIVTKRIDIRLFIANTFFVDYLTAY